MSTERQEIGASVLEDLADEEGVRKLIECPICLEIPLPPIYLCAKGHIVCGHCQARTFACPLCRERYCNTRSFVAEGIVEKCTLRCRYADGGCEAVMKGSDLSEHLNVCEFRPVKCRECGDKLINYLDYEQHLFRDHKLSGTSGTEAFVAYRINLNFIQRSFVDTCFWPQYYIKAFDRLFLLRLNAHNYSIHPWVCLLGPQAECERYNVLIEYEPCSDGSIVHSWRGPVNHFRDEPTEVISKGKALSIPMDAILEVGSVSSERAEWIYHIILCERYPAESFESTANYCEDAVNLELTTTSDESPNESKGKGDPNPTAPTSAVTVTSTLEDEHELSVTTTTPNPVRPPQRVGAGINPGLPRSGATSRNAGAVGFRPIERKPKCSVQSFARIADRIVESAGNQGDIDDSSDFDWDI